MLVALVLLVLVYLPVVSGWPKGWSLYAFWALLGLASLVAAEAIREG